MDNLDVADTETMGRYLTLESSCDNKQQAVHPLPIQITNEKIISSTQIALLSHQYLPIQARKAHLFPGLNEALLYIVTCAIMDAKPPLMTILSLF